LRIKANKVKQISDSEHLAEKELEVEQKLDAFIALLDQHAFDSKTVKHFQQRFNNAVEKKIFDAPNIDAFKTIAQEDHASREELLDQFSSLLLSNKIDSNISSKYIRSERAVKIVLMLVGIIMIALGFAMIIMPAPPYFEMFTIFYFTRDDGVTLMDIISLIIILTGIYILVRSIYKKTLTSN
jgi:hypothetical protein